MKRCKWVFIALASLAVSVCAQEDPDKLGKILAKAYPDFIAGVKDGQVLWKDGTRMSLADGGQDRPWLERLNKPVLADQFFQVYPLGAPAVVPPAKNFDPGRIRYEPFFKKMYGETQAAVEANLVPLRWLPALQNTVVMVTKINGVDIKLAAISSELERLGPEFQPYLKDIAGTYNYRMINNSNRLSMHSLGIAIDLNPTLTESWDWTYSDEMDDIRYQNRLPYAIAAIFEKYGFVWGGKWYHYDTMHFEYRPELFVSTD